MQTTTLVMYFLTSEGKKVSINVDEPRSDLNPIEVKDAMGTIVAQKALFDGLITDIHSAQVVTRTVSEYDIQ